jgi:hypothetical protein
MVVAAEYRLPAADIGAAEQTDEGFVRGPLGQRCARRRLGARRSRTWRPTLGRSIHQHCERQLAHDVGTVTHDEHRRGDDRAHRIGMQIPALEHRLHAADVLGGHDHQHPLL